METALPQRSARHARKSAETDISLSLTLDGSGTTDIQTGFGMLDHMLTLTAFWAGMDLHLRCRGDLHIDAHHSAEDIGLVLGQAVLEALGTAWASPVGYGRVPMDEALSDVTIDLSGRPWLEWRGDELLPPVIAGEEKRPLAGVLQGLCQQRPLQPACDHALRKKWSPPSGIRRQKPGTGACPGCPA